MGLSDGPRQFCSLKKARLVTNTRFNTFFFMVLYLEGDVLALYYEMSAASKMEGKQKRIGLLRIACLCLTVSPCELYIICVLTVVKYKLNHIMRF